MPRASAAEEVAGAARRHPAPCIVTNYTAFDESPTEGGSVAPPPPPPVAVTITEPTPQQHLGDSTVGSLAGDPRQDRYASVATRTYVESSESSSSSAGTPLKEQQRENKPDLLNEEEPVVLPEVPGDVGETSECEGREHEGFLRTQEPPSTLNRKPPESAFVPEYLRRHSSDTATHLPLKEGIQLNEDLLWFANLNRKYNIKLNHFLPSSPSPPPSSSPSYPCSPVDGGEPAGRGSSSKDEDLFHKHVLSVLPAEQVLELCRELYLHWRNSLVHLGRASWDQSMMCVGEFVAEESKASAEEGDGLVPSPSSFIVPTLLVSPQHENQEGHPQLHVDSRQGSSLSESTTLLTPSSAQSVPGALPTQVVHHFQKNTSDEGLKVINDKYVILDEIGRGTRGKVKMAVSLREFELAQVVTATTSPLNEVDDDTPSSGVGGGEEEDSVPFAIKIIKRDKLRKRFQRVIVKRGSVSSTASPSPRSQTSGSPLLPPRNITAFHREIAIMKRLHHPHIVPLLEVIDDPMKEKIYMVMPLIGRGAFVKLGPNNCRCQPLSLDVCRLYFRQISAAIHYLHARGIVHRDIKPDNILLGYDGNVYLADFGQSEMFSVHTKTETKCHGTPCSPWFDPISQLEGSPLFMAPELLLSTTSDTGRSGLKPSHEGVKFSPSDSTSDVPNDPQGPERDKKPRSTIRGNPVDIWALGVTFFCALFGRPPFDTGAAATSFFLLRKAHERFTSATDAYRRYVAPRPMHARRSSIATDLDDDTVGGTATPPSLHPVLSLLDSMLEKDPSKRATIADVRKHPFVKVNRGSPKELKATTPSPVDREQLAVPPPAAQDELASSAKLMAKTIEEEEQAANEEGVEPVARLFSPLIAVSDEHVREWSTAVSSNLNFSQGSSLSSIKGQPQAEGGGGGPGYQVPLTLPLVLGGTAVGDLPSRRRRSLDRPEVPPASRRKSSSSTAVKVPPPTAAADPPASASVSSPLVVEGTVVMRSPLWTHPTASAEPPQGTSVDISLQVGERRPCPGTGTGSDEAKTRERQSQEVPQQPAAAGTRSCPPERREQSEMGSAEDMELQRGTGRKSGGSPSRITTVDTGCGTTTIPKPPAPHPPPGKSPPKARHVN